MITSCIAGLADRVLIPSASGEPSTWLIRQVERDRSLAPYAAYRLALAGVVLRRLWQDRRP